jgi:membrane protease YdiL (CAAX protease family)
MSINEITPTGNEPLLKGWIRAILITIPYIIFSAIFTIIGYSLLGMHPVFHSALTITETVILQITLASGTLILVFIFTRYLDRVTLKSLGFQLKDFRQNILSGIATGAIIMATGFSVLLMLDEICVININYDWYKLAACIVYFSVVAFSEELIMRGYILNNLMQSMNKYVALVISSLIFAIFHMFNPNIDTVSFISIILAGLLLGVSYIHTKNLWFPIALHFSWNFFQGTVFGFRVSGREIYSVIIQHPEGNSILNGGQFGFEGSVVSQILIIIAVIWLLVRRKNRT